MSPVIVNLTCWTITVLALGLYFAPMPAQRRRQARDREFERLQKPPETFPGIVWGCAKWRKCDSRLIQAPPYDGDEAEPLGPCGTHGLPMSTKVVERRVIS